MLQLNNISKSFMDGARQRMVLQSLSLTVEDGDFIAITGESGAGKTTLLRILSTMLQPDGGTYLLDGRDMVALHAQGDDALAPVRNQHIGMVYQDHRLLPQFDVLQNILLPTLAQKDHASAQDIERAHSLMQFMGIDALQHQSVTSLSGGEQTRVAICRALICNPTLLLADEPTGQLDAQNAATIARLFHQVCSQLHTTIVMVTHSAHMAQSAHRIYNLCDGVLQQA